MSEYSHLRIPLLTLLSHPRCRQSLRAFALQEHSEETICFIEDVEGLRELYPAWLAEKERTQPSQQQQRQQQTRLRPHSSFAGDSSGDGLSELKLPAELEPAAEEAELQHGAPTASASESAAQTARSVNSVSLQSPLHRHSLLCGVAHTRGSSDSAALRDFTFPITAAAGSSSSAAAGLRLDASRSWILTARGEPVSAVGLVTQAAMAIWSRYQPGSQWAVSWHPEQLRAVQAAIKAGGGRLDSPLLFNGQEELEIENVQAGTLSRFYSTSDYRRLCDDLLAELALSVQRALAGAHTSRFSATAPVDAKPVAAASPVSALQSARLLSAIAETKEQTHSAREPKPDSAVNLSTIQRVNTAISVSCTPTQVSAPGSPANCCESPASPVSPVAAISRPALRLRNGRSLLSLNLHQDADAALSEADSEDERKTATPLLRQSSSQQILLPRRSPSSAATEKESRPKTAAPPVQAVRRLSQLPSLSSPTPPATRARCSSAVISSPASPSSPTSPAGELELLCQRGFFLFHFNPLGSQVLRQYMASEWSLDNYDCLLAIDAFSSRAMTDAARRREAKAIVHSFLSINSKHEVTFPSDLRAELTRTLSSCTQTPPPCSLFDPVFDVVLQTVRIDVFRRFVRSADYHKLSAKMTDRLSGPAVTPCSLPAVSRVSQVSVSPSGFSFSDVLNDSELLSAYTAFCQREHSEEYLLFYQAAQRYRELDRSDPDEINGLVQRIYARYVVENSDYEVHFPLQLKTELKREMAYPHPELYDKTMAFVVAVMREDSGKRFLTSPECRNAVRKRSAS